MTRKSLSIGTVAMAVAWSVAAPAQTIPQSFTFTARVSNADGPLSGTHQMILRMFDAPTGGTKLWEESHIDVEVTDGLVTLGMGSETNITNGDLTDDGVWVEVVVDGSTLAPRIQLRAVPYSRRTQDALTLRGNAPSAFAAAGHNHDSAYVNAGGDTMTNTLSITSGGLYVSSTGGVQTHIPYWPNGWNYLTGNGTIFREPSAGNEYARIAGDGWATLGGVLLSSANVGDCPGGWFCNIYAWDISAASMLYSGLVQRSDRRLKKDIEPMARGLDAIAALRPVTFLWKDGRIKGRQYGFIAQDVEQVIPELVTENSKGYKALDTIGILPVTVKAVQQLKAENDRLRTDVDQLRDEIEALKAGHALPPRGTKTASRWVGPVSLGGGTLVFAFGLIATVRRRRNDPSA